MTSMLHESSQETETGNGITCPEPALIVQNLIVDVSELSVDSSGSVSFKVQHSADGSTWIDVPNLSTGNIISTGTTTISLNPSCAVLDYQRLAWSFSNANSITFSAYITGTK